MTIDGEPDAVLSERSYLKPLIKPLTHTWEVPFLLMVRYIFMIARRYQTLLYLFETFPIIVGASLTHDALAY